MSLSPRPSIQPVSLRQCGLRHPFRAGRAGIHPPSGNFLGCLPRTSPRRPGVTTGRVLSPTGPAASGEPAGWHWQGAETVNHARLFDANTAKIIPFGIPAAWIDIR